MASHGQLDQAMVGGFAEHFATQPLENVLTGHFPERLQRSAEVSKVWRVLPSRTALVCPLATLPSDVGSGLHTVRS